MSSTSLVYPRIAMRPRARLVRTMISWAVCSAVTGAVESTESRSFERAIAPWYQPRSSCSVHSASSIASSRPRSPASTQ